jgi:hypothetical protein
MPLQWQAVPYLVAYLVILIPFYHGALRHLEVTHVSGSATNPVSLLMDWGLLFIESCMFLVLAMLIGRPRAFSCVLFACSF